MVSRGYFLIASTAYRLKDTAHGLIRGVDELLRMLERNRILAAAAHDPGDLPRALLLCELNRIGARVFARLFRLYEVLVIRICRNLR